MASIGEVYGNDFKERSKKEKIVYSAKLIATNLAHKEFAFRSESFDMWEGHNMYQDAINTIVTHIPTVNPNCRAVYIDKRTDKVNMLPYLINGAVEYFSMVDL